MGSGVLALVPAAGDGVRLGAHRPKALVQLGGVPLVVRAVSGLFGSGVVDAVVVTAGAAFLGEFRSLFATEPRVDVVVGGADRSASVRAALDHGLRGYPETATVLVHDAARPLTPSSMIRAVVAARVDERRAVVPVLPLADTVKRVDASDAVVSTLDRTELRAVQTPQAFEVAVLRRAYRDPAAATDDAGLVERLGVRVHTVPGDPHAFKITTSWDLRLASLLVDAG